MIVSCSATLVPAPVAMTPVAVFPAIWQASASTLAPSPTARPDPKQADASGLVSWMNVSRNATAVSESCAKTPTEVLPDTKQACASRLAPPTICRPYPYSPFASGRLSWMVVSWSVTSVSASPATTPAVAFPHSSQDSEIRSAPPPTTMP